MRLILASSSPRRAELLSAAGVPFVVDAEAVDESQLADETPAACVERLALLKARAVQPRHPGAIVVAADTTVVIEGRMLAKPGDDEEATEMLRALSGRAHEVLTGIAVLTRGEERSSVERTEVWMAALTEQEIAWYVASGEPRDRAGAYAIQGLASRFILKINGSYANVVGLPVPAVLQIVRELGLAVS